MKQSIFALAAGFIFALGTNNANAQTVSFKTALKQAADSNMSAVLDKKDDAITMAGKSQPAKVNDPEGVNINEKARKNFSKKFAGVSDEFWEKTNEGFSATFNANKARNIVYYDEKGNWKASLKSYNEDQLPAEVSNAVKNEYYGATITYVHEILTRASAGEPTYLIQMENKKHLLEVRYNNGNVDTWKQYDKQ